MAEQTSISWTDATWNPWMGCDRVSTECDHCYIDRTLRRRGVKAFGELHRAAAATWTLPANMQKKALQDDRRYKIFTCSLSDFFHAKADAWRPEAWQKIRQCPDVDFLILTKRPARIARHLPPDWGQGWPNVWLGVSVGVRKSLPRVEELRKIPAIIRFISAEPLLESLAGLDLSGIDWLIAGGESGPEFRPMETTWAIELRDACAAASVSFWFKQTASPRSGTNPEALGRIHHDYPATATQGVRSLFTQVEFGDTVASPES